MSFLVFLSRCMIPLLVFSVTGYGILKKIPVYDSFIRGAMDGIRTTVKLIPTLIGLMTAAGVLGGLGVSYPSVRAAGKAPGWRILSGSAAASGAGPHVL